GVLDDYAFLTDGLLALHEATGDARWLAPAQRLADVMLARFEDDAGGGFFLTPESSNLLIRPKPFEDNAIPSGNGVALRVLRTLAGKPGAERYAKAAARIPSSAGALLERAPHALPTTVAVLLGTPAPKSSVLAAAQPEAASARTHERKAFRLPRSGDHVRARLVRMPEADPARFAVHLAIDDGWHVNANPASFAFLVATAVERIEGGTPLEIRYPKGESFQPDFADEPIQVYEGAVEIPVSLSDGASGSPRLAVRFQACDDAQCLPPDRVVLALEAPNKAAP
ncbi:MAG: protein-disulfide reductase DsbD domain-containing protein, partial [Myxococcota bacterium]